MLLEFHSIELFNFKSYKGKHRFEFPASPGLYFLTGRNDANPRLGANGVGKSTLLDAVYWCLYGWTLRGLRGNEVVGRGLKSASVTLHLAIGDQDYTIKRVQSPNLLTVNKEIVDQQYLTKLIRLTPEQFTYSVIFPQFGSPFLDRKPAEKLELFGKILGLDYWLERSDQAKAQTEELQRAITVQEQLIAKQEGQYEALEKEMPRLKNKQFEAEDLAKIVAGFEAKLKAVQQKLKLAQERSQKAREINAVAQAAVEKTKQTIDKLGKLGSACPICLQTVSAAHLKRAKGGLLAHLTHQKTNADAALADSRAAASEASKLVIDEGAIAQNLAGFTQKQAEAATYAKMAQSHKSQMDALEVSITSIDHQIDRLVVAKDQAQFWVAGFKRLRLYIIEQVLRQLEIEVNNNLANLGLPNWQITFDVERENKSGGITKGFTVYVQPPGSGGPVRLEAWSGGEYQRLRLAGELGLANLIMERAGLTNTIEFFDEASQHLSAEGVADFAETLAERAADTNRTIFLVDHTSVESGNFAGVITVVKDKEGSHVAV